ncbi:MAG: succinate dehydrogenase/fumarate reductase iron-sulfur subunit [Sulfolobales archaeon]
MSRETTISKFNTSSQQLAVTKAFTKLMRVKIKRYDPETGKFKFSEYKVEVSRYDTVLDVLMRIIRDQDHTLSVRYSCRMGICGSCAMMINGKPRLACMTNAISLGESIYIEPLKNFPPIKDLMVDMDSLFRKHRSVKPWLIRKDEEEQFLAKKEYLQKPEEVNAYRIFSTCIKCGVCVAACPTAASNPRFLGPMVLAQAYRWSADSRDEGAKIRLEIVDSIDGVFGCHFAGACSASCPKNADPALAIQYLRRFVLTYKR